MVRRIAVLSRKTRKGQKFDTTTDGTDNTDGKEKFEASSSGLDWQLLAEN